MVVRGGREKLAFILPVASLSYKRLILGLESLVGRERLVVLSQEQLLVNATAAMSRIFTSMGLPPVQSQDFGKIINSGTEKGAYRVGSAKMPGEYFRLTRATQQELMAWFREDCVWLRDERGIHFRSAC